MKARSLLVGCALVGGALMLVWNVASRRACTQPTPKLAGPKLGTLQAKVGARPTMPDEQALHDIYDRVSFES